MVSVRSVSKTNKVPRLPLVALLFLLLSTLGILALLRAAVQRSSHVSQNVPAYANAASDSLSRDNSFATSPVVYLFGDIGVIRDSLLDAYARHLAAERSPKLIVFLGDNVYPAGVREGEKGSKDKRLLKNVIERLGSPSSRVLFIPGNHDWDYHSKDGARAIVRQQKFIESLLGPESFFPRRACPGPELAFNEEGIRLIALDSQWFLHRHEKPAPDSERCYGAGSAVLKTRFNRLMEATHIGHSEDTASPDTRPSLEIVALHHPFKSHGPHGLNNGCYQDLGCETNAAAMHEIQAALPPTSSLRLCVSGHDHSLQVLAGDESCARYLISGGASKVSRVSRGADTHFAESALGFIEVRILDTSALELKVWTMQKDGRGVYQARMRHVERIE